MKHLGLHYDKNSNWQQAMWERLISLLKSSSASIDQTKNILDLGCGSGIQTKAALNIFPTAKKILAIDIDESMIEAARYQNQDSRIEYRVLDINRISDIQHYSSDVVMAHWCLHWIDNKNSLLENLIPLTYDGTLFLMSTCERLPNLLQVIDNEIHSSFKIEAPSPFHYLTAKQWQELLTQWGWEIISIETQAITHTVPSGMQFINIWFSASTGAAFYGYTIDTLGNEFLTNLIELLDAQFGRVENNTWEFVEETLFLVARRVSSFKQTHWNPKF
jgi:trans-aconitate methyltransferase